ncbi:hypothetical protein XENTR_v10017169 [Xenopus tropicalis]|nr:hypothetical protein XENTR_v10017169 [Xenopus tropicalis]
MSYPGDTYVFGSVESGLYLGQHKVPIHRYTEHLSLPKSLLFSSSLPEVPGCHRFQVSRGSRLPEVPSCQRFQVAIGSRLPEVPGCQRFQVARGSRLPEVPGCQRFQVARGSRLPVRTAPVSPPSSSFSQNGLWLGYD